MYSDVDWRKDVTNENLIYENGRIKIGDKPGLGIDDYNDEVIKEHLHPQYPTLWEETSRWDDVYSHDRLWS